MVRADQCERRRELFGANSRLCRKSPPKRRFASGSTDFCRRNVYVTSATHAPSTPAHPTLNRPNMVSVGTVVWLSSELMFFAGLFAMYFTLRSTSGQMWAEETAKLNFPFALVNTIVLVASSFTCQMGVFGAERLQPRRAGGALQFARCGMNEWFILAFLMGVFFVAAPTTEYAM